MTAKSPKEAAGKALYLEFRQGVYTFQVIFTPHTIGLDGNLVAQSYLRRRVSTFQPRKKWSIDVGYLQHFDDFERNPFTGQFLEIGDPERANKFAGIFYHQATYQINQLVRQDWKLYQKPLVVEFSYEDLGNIRNGKFPTGLYRRIERSRKNLGWSESIVETPVAV